MLLPFEINEAVVKENGLSLHAVDWVRIQILKEIDDIRFMALSEGNMDLSLDALKALKLYRLVSLANPKVDTNGVLMPLAPISYCFDISKEELTAHIQKFINTSRAIGGATQPLTAVNVQFGLISAKRLKFSRLLSTSASSRMDAVPSTCYATFSKHLGIWNNIPAEVQNAVSGELKVDTSSVFSDAKVKNTFFSTVRETIQTFDSMGRAVTKVVTVSTRTFPINPTEAVSKWTGTDSAISSTSFIDSSISNFPEMLYGLCVEADIAASIYWNTNLRPTIEMINKSTVKSSVLADYVSCVEPYYYYTQQDYTFPLKTPAGAAYTLKVLSTSPTFVQWYRRTTVTLENGKSFTYPNINVSGLTSPFANGIGHILLTVLSKKFHELNRSLYNFPTSYPDILNSGQLRLRNGYLVANAANFYEPEFKMFPDALLTKIETLIVLQASISALRDDIRNRELITYLDGSGNTRAYYYDEYGKRVEFVHPISLAPIDPNKYINELVVESAVQFDAIKKDIDAFMAPLKTFNDQAYQKAYEKYLLGEATIKGPEALAEYERKLATGIFYMENGFNYWRPFTQLEITLIEQMKLEAAAQKAQYEKNQENIKLNAYYLEQANAAIEKYNLDTMSLAETIAKAELQKQADAELAKIPVPTVEYLIARAKAEGGFPTDILNKWVQENPYYYARPDLVKVVDELLKTVTMAEQQVATALVADQVAEVEFTKALQSLFTIN